MLGPIHGFVGNVAALGDSHGANEVLARTALIEGDRANWPPSIGWDRVPRLQWCHGAPGIVATASAYLDEELLIAGASLVWDAGPPLAEEKGAGVCHGTAGNGYGLLKTFERTGDELWLERARAFAMHAAAQVDRARAQYGRGRYTLWTGDPGTALYLADCLDGAGELPLT
jgi:Lanthionine synthetase C-like protein